MTDVDKTHVGKIFLDFLENNRRHPHYNLIYFFLITISYLFIYIYCIAVAIKGIKN